MPAKLYAQHSTWIQGALDFGNWICKKSGVAYVNQGNVRSSHIKAGRRDPKFSPQKHNVLAFWFAGGQLQTFRVFHTSDTTIEKLAHDLEAAWYKYQNRGGLPGESSKSPVGEPIRKPSTTPTTVTEPADKPKTPPQDVVVVVSNIAARAYQLLLDQGGNAERFTLTGVSSLLQKQLGLSGMVNAMAQLRAVGLLSRGQSIKGTQQKTFTVLRRPFEIRTAIHDRGKLVGNVPVEFLEMDPTEHLRFFERHQAMLEEARLRRQALKKQGFEVTEFRGVLSLTTIHRTRPS